jgi:hypothetical protein
MVEISEDQSPLFNDDIPMVAASLLPDDDRLEQTPIIIEADSVGGPDAHIPDTSLVFDSFASSSRSSSSSSHSSSASLPVQAHVGMHQRQLDPSAQSTGSRTQEEEEVVSSPFNDSSIDEINGGSSSRRSNNKFNNNRNIDNNVTLAAGAAGCVLGFMTGGFFWVILCGSVLAHSSTQEGMAGDISRALGDVAITAQQNFYAVDEKHHIIDKTKRMISNIISYLQKQVKKVEENDPDMDAFLAMDGKSKVKTVLWWTWKKLGELERRHNLIERGAVELKALLGSTYEMAVKLVTTMCQERQEQ